MNRDLEAAWTYHDQTKHSYWSVRSGRHRLHWDNKPLPFKIYLDLEPIPLPEELAPSAFPALEAIAAPGLPFEGQSPPDLGTLSRLLYFSAGITKRKRMPGGDIYFRAASCTGALYHIDLYLICGDLRGLEAGVYHFGVHDFALRRLRQGDFRAEVVRATAAEPAVAEAPVIVASTSTFWHNAWKYQARTYRHCFWDNGTLLANLLAVAAASRLPARLVLGFVDQTMNRLLGLDERQEVTLSLVALGHAPDSKPAAAPPVEPLELRTAPLSAREISYPAILAMHAASSLTSEAEARAWRAPVPAEPLPQPASRLLPLASLEQTPSTSIEEVILRRGSSRRFLRQAIGFGQLATLLEASSGDVPADFTARLNDPYLILNAVEGAPGGAYVFHPQRRALELLKEGDFRRQAGYLGLEQELPAEASAGVFYLTDLRSVLERLGNRGYRAAQLEAGIRAGKLYLAAYALGLGASGLTFYDDEVTAFFSPHAAGKSVLFLLALGHPASRGRLPRARRVQV